MAVSNYTAILVNVRPLSAYRRDIELQQVFTKPDRLSRSLAPFMGLD